MSLPTVSSAIRQGNAKVYTEREINNFTNNLARENLIAIGGNAEIYKGKIDGEAVAIKKYTVDANHLTREAQSISLCKHPNVVRMKGLCFNPCYLVMEYMSNGSLKDYIDNENRYKELSMSKIIEIFKIISETLDFAHKKGHIHQDINPSIVLFDESRTPKIAGFELSTFYTNPQSLHLVSTELHKGIYSDPEIFRSKLCGKHTDIYSLGMVIMTVICNKCPLLAVKRKVEKILDGKIELKEFTFHEWPEDVSPTSLMCHDIVEPILNLAIRCVDSNVINRPSAEEMARGLEQMFEKSRTTDNIS